jgi:hypothetical protein
VGISAGHRSAQPRGSQSALWGMQLEAMGCCDVEAELLLHVYPKLLPCISLFVFVFVCCVSSIPTGDGGGIDCVYLCTLDGLPHMGLTSYAELMF